MEIITGYKGIKHNVLSKKQIHKKYTIYLIECENNNFAYGNIDDIQSLYFVPVNQYGTAKEIILHCQCVIDFLENNMENIKDFEILKNITNNEIDGLTNFINILNDCN